MDQENKMRYFLVIIFLIFLNGCSFKEIKPTNYYALEFNNELPSFSTKKESIVIKRPILTPPYNSKNIFFTQKPYIYEKYSVNKWIEFPTLMLENLLYKRVKNSLLFKHTKLQDIEQKTSLKLLSRVNKLLHTYKNTQSFAQVEIEFTLVEKETILSTITIKKEILCEENSPYGFVKASNIALEEISLEVLKYLEKALS